jgi:hypothetical protein
LVVTVSALDLLGITNLIANLIARSTG